MSGLIESETPPPIARVARSRRASKIVPVASEFPDPPPASPALVERILLEFARRVPGTPVLLWEVACSTGEFGPVGFDGPFPLAALVCSQLEREQLIARDDDGWHATTRGRHVADLISPNLWRKE